MKRRRARRCTSSWRERVSPALLKKRAKEIAARNGITEAELIQATKPTREKYGNRKVTVDGRTFDSGREARRFLELAILQGKGEIADLECQPAFELHASGGVKVGKFTPDFRYQVVATGEIVVEDVKSKPTRTEAYMLRKTFLKAEYGITLTEVY